MLPIVLLALFHVAPLSKLIFTTSPVAVAALRVPLIVWAAVLVMKSVVLVPVSAEKVTVLTVAVGAIVSTLMAKAVELPVLPAASVWVTVMLSLP